MKINIKKIALATVCLSLISANVSIFASPSFTRSSEEWERLRDNKLEYDEIQGLIEEYNPTVKENESTYLKFRKDYGDTNTKVRDNYRKMADEILDSISDADPSSPSYISILTANANATSQAESLLNNADNALEDATIMKLNNDLARATLVWNAKNNMINYYIGGLNIEKSNLQKEEATLSLVITKLNFSLGSTTKAEVLKAEDNLLKSEQSIANATKEKEKLAKKLQTMTGWSYEAVPEFGILPELNLEKIKTYNPSTDLTKAIENNYTLKINERKLANASSEDTKTKLQTTISSNKTNIALSLNNAYTNINVAKANYEAASSNLKLEKDTLQSIELKAKLGLASETELKVAQIEEKLADINLKSSEYALFSAMEAYEWNINGLASATTGAN